MLARYFNRACCTATSTTLRASSSVQRCFSTSSTAFTAASSTTPSASSSRILSGIQPTGIVHLGNYLGAIQSWVRLQNGTLKVDASSNAPNPELYLFIADWHAVDSIVDPSRSPLDLACLRSAAQLLACGLDPKRSTLFLQSDVPDHLTLDKTLQKFAPESSLRRMTQYKDKSKSRAGGSKPGGLEQSQGVPVDLLIYPVLQAADILLYRATHVPVGEDQHQHIELCRELARRFNSYASASTSSSTAFQFPLPEHFSTPTSRIMSLRTGTSKMSKSDPSDAGRINLTDTSDMIAQKIKKAVTDSVDNVTYDLEGRPQLANLLHILSAVSDRSIESILADPSISSTKQQLKRELTDRLVQLIDPIRSEHTRLMDDQTYLRKTLIEGGDRARRTAQETTKSVLGVTKMLSLRE